MVRQEHVTEDVRVDSMVLTVTIHVVITAWTVSSTEAVPGVNLVTIGVSVNRHVQTVRTGYAAGMMDIVDKDAKMVIKEQHVSQVRPYIIK